MVNGALLHDFLGITQTMRWAVGLSYWLFNAKKPKMTFTWIVNVNNYTEDESFVWIRHYFSHKACQVNTCIEISIPFDTPLSSRITLALVIVPYCENSLRSRSSSIVSSKFFMYKLTPWYRLILSCFWISNFIFSSLLRSALFCARHTVSFLPLTSVLCISFTAFWKKKHFLKHTRCHMDLTYGSIEILNEWLISLLC